MLIDKGERQCQWPRTLQFTSFDVEKVSEHVRAFGKRAEIHVVEFFLRKMIVTVICLGKSPHFSIFLFSCHYGRLLFSRQLDLLGTWVMPILAFSPSVAAPLLFRVLISTGRKTPANISSSPFPEQHSLGHTYVWENVFSYRSTCVVLWTGGIEKRKDGSFVGQHRNTHSSRWKFRAGMWVLALLYDLYGWKITQPPHSVFSSLKWGWS